MHILICDWFYNFAMCTIILCCISSRIVQRTGMFPQCVCLENLRVLTSWHVFIKRGFVMVTTIVLMVQTRNQNCVKTSPAVRISSSVTTRCAFLATCIVMVIPTVLTKVMKKFVVWIALYYFCYHVVTVCFLNFLLYYLYIVI